MVIKMEDNDDDNDDKENGYPKGMLEAGMVACWEDLVKDTKLFYVLEKNSSCDFIVIVTLLKVFPGEKNW